jgi:hypothetical protein
LAQFFLRYWAHAVSERGSGSNNREPVSKWIQDRRAAFATLFAMN